MKLQNHLSKEQQEKLKKLKYNNKPKHKRKKKKPERIDWHDIMGVNRDTYKRGKGGAIRKK